MRSLLPILLFSASLPAVEPAPGCVGVDGTVPLEARISAHERLVEILKADSPEIPADIWECTHAVCKKPFRSKRKGEPSFFAGRVENGALLRAAAQYNAVNTISWLLKERKADPHDMLWDNYGSPLSDEVSPLHVAARYGSVEAARLLLAAGVNPNVVDKLGNTPLMLAAASGGERAYDMVNLLLAHGAHPSLRNYVGKAAVDLVPPRAQRVFGKLCWYGVKPQNAARYDAWVREESMSFSSDNPILYFWYAVHADDLVQAEEWLKKGVNPQADVMGVRPLWVAINHGNADMVRLLMRYGAEFPEYADKAYFPWLYAVALCGNPDILDLIPYAEPKEDVAESPLVVALRGRCSVEMVAAMLERGANPEARSLNAARVYTCHQIVRNHTHDTQVLRLLHTLREDWSLYESPEELQEYVELPGFFALDKRGGYARTPAALYRADKNEAAASVLLSAGADEAPVCFKRNLQTMQWEFGTAPAVQDNAAYAQQTQQALVQNDTSYFVAMAKEDLNRRFAPVMCAASEFDLGNRSGRYYMATPLQHAAAGGKVSILRVLIARGADPEQADAYGKSAIVYAAANGHVECVRLLLNAGAKQHGLALQMAALCGQHAVVDYLLSRGVRAGLAPEYALMSEHSHAGLLSMRKPDADMALGLAVRLDYPQAVQRLIAAGGNVNRPNFFPLHENFDVEVLKVLIEAGADVNRTNKDGLTPLEYHRKNGHTAAVEYLESVSR